MVHRFVRLGLDQDFALEADLVLVLDDHREETAKVFQLAREVCVQECVIAFAAAPQDIVFAAKPVRGFKAFADLADGAGGDFRVRVRQATGRIARMAEQVRGAPEQLRAGFLLVGGEIVAGPLEIV